ncbi:hypothetical protein GWN42_09420, partial [candidate division KSB1 bacterium]|nr:hypothetical protein [candidate division KSB1 bacterium]
FTHHFYPSFFIVQPTPMVLGGFEPIIPLKIIEHMKTIPHYHPLRLQYLPYMMDFHPNAPIKEKKTQIEWDNAQILTINPESSDLLCILPREVEVKKKQNPKEAIIQPPIFIGNSKGHQFDWWRQDMAERMEKLFAYVENLQQGQEQKEQIDE